jgi:hypothetical protein
MTESETSKVAEAKALEAQLRLEVGRQRNVLEHLNRGSKRDP